MPLRAPRPSRPALSLVRAAEYLLREVGAPLIADGSLEAVPPIPGATSTGWGCVVFETRLSGTDPRVDVMSALARPALLDSRPATSPARSGWWHHPLVHAWLEPRLEDVPLLWFEWDVMERAARDPLVFVCVSDSILGSTRSPGPDRSARALTATLSEQPTSPWRTQLERCIEALGDRGELLHIAWLGPRERRRLRLVFHVEARSVRAWLEALGWPGSTTDVWSALFRVTSPWRRLGVQLELEPELGPYLGLEIPEYRDEPDAGRRFASTLTQVASLARVEPNRARQLARWPGRATLADPSDPLEVLRHGYVKLVRERDGWQAKGYLALTPTGALETSRSPSVEGPPPPSAAFAR